MTQQIIDKPSPEHFAEYLHRKYGLNTKIKYDKILISGKPRGSRKTSTVFDFILNEYPQLFGKKKPPILYVTKVIGTVEQSDNHGTFYDTEKTIRRIEKASPNYKGKQLKICMVAGKEKTCSVIAEIKDDLEKMIICDDCDYIGHIDSNKENNTEEVNNFIKKIKRIPTLTPYETKKLADEHNICSKAIIKFYAQHIADIVLMTYAMIPHWEPKIKAPVVIYDEARHILELPDIVIASFKYESGKRPTQEFINNQVLSFLDPNFDSDDNEVPEFIDKKLETYISHFLTYIHIKLMAFHQINEIIRSSKDENEYSFEKYKEQLEFVNTNFNYLGFVEWADEIIGRMNPFKINKFLKDLVRNYKLEWQIVEPDDERKRLERYINSLRILDHIAGCSHVEIELLRTPGLKKQEDTYNIILRPFEYMDVEKDAFVFFIDATPFPKIFYKLWLQQPVDTVVLPDNTPVTIIYENAKRSTPEIYGYSDERESFSNHILLINGIIDLCDKLGLKYAVVARTKEVKGILEGQGIHVDLSCGDINAEGVQLDADVLILEGTQIRNIGAGVSMKYSLGRMLNIEPTKAFYEYGFILNAQQLIQTSFRAVDSNGKKRNIIIMLGNMMTHRDSCWVEYAKEHWSWLKNNNMAYHMIDLHSLIENKVKSIGMVLSKKKGKTDLSYLENQILLYIKGRNNSRVKKSSCVNHFLKSNKVIHKTKKENYDAIKNLVKKGYITDEGGVLSVKNKNP